MATLKLYLTGIFGKFRFFIFLFKVLFSFLRCRYCFLLYIKISKSFRHSFRHSFSGFFSL
nr:MAG TPA: hypothetical protein [Caudoviricetes sp.]